MIVVQFFARARARVFTYSTAYKSSVEWVPGRETRETDQLSPSSAPVVELYLHSLIFHYCMMLN
jgi:hypothetical protein